MLNDKQIKALKPRETAYYETDDTGRRGHGRLAVKVYPTGRKVFYFAYKMGSKRQFIALGDYPGLSLKDATATASQYGQWLFEGKDPKDVLDEQAKATEAAKKALKAKELEGSVSQLLELYLNKLQRERSQRHFECVRKVLNPNSEIVRILGPETKANQIEPEHIAQALRPFVQRDSLIMGNRARSYLSAAFSYGMSFDFSPERGPTDPLFRLKYNPVTAVPKPIKSEAPAERILDEEELRTFWGLVEKSQLAIERKILLKLMLTFGGLRVTEICECPWSEIDLKAGLWSRPAKRDKTNRLVLLPLGRMTHQLLTELHSITGHLPYLFGDKPVSSGAVHQMVERLCEGNMAHFPPKALRPTVKTIMGRLGVSKEARDRYHNHALQDVSSKHYDKFDYLDQKREFVRVWENFLSDVITGNDHHPGLRAVV